MMQSLFLCFFFNYRKSFHIFYKYYYCVWPYLSFKIFRSFFSEAFYRLSIFWHCKLHTRQKVRKTTWSGKNLKWKKKLKWLSIFINFAWMACQRNKRELIFSGFLSTKNDIYKITDKHILRSKNASIASEMKEILDERHFIMKTNSLFCDKR